MLAQSGTIKLDSDGSLSDSTAVLLPLQCVRVCVRAHAHALASLWMVTSLRVRILFFIFPHLKFSVQGLAHGWHSVSTVD